MTNNCRRNFRIGTVGLPDVVQKRLRHWLKRRAVRSGWILSLTRCYKSGCDWVNGPELSSRALRVRLEGPATVS